MRRAPSERKNSLVPIGDALADLPGPVQAIRDDSPQALHHYTQADQVNALVGASEADPDLSFMARMLACSLSFSVSAFVRPPACRAATPAIGKSMSGATARTP